MNVGDTVRFDFDLLCAVCVGMGRELFRQETVEDYAWRDCEQCNGTGIPPIPISEFRL